MKLREAAEYFKAVSEPNRARILAMLRNRPLCVCEITSILKTSAPTVSKHLTTLRRLGFVEDEKRGKWIYYRLTDAPRNHIIEDVIQSIDKWFGDIPQMKEDAEAVGKLEENPTSCSI